MNEDYLRNQFFSVRRSTSGLWEYRTNPSGSTSEGAIVIQSPIAPLDGATTTLKPSGEPRVFSKSLANGVTEISLVFDLRDDLFLTATFRSAPDSPVLRFRYTLQSMWPRALSKPDGRDALEYLRLSLADFAAVTELRLSEFVEIVHSYCPNEVPVRDCDFDGSASVMGPIILAGGEGSQLLMAYEHGSTYPDAYLHYALSPDRTVALRAVKGNTLDGQIIDPEHPFETVWFDLAAIHGSADEMAMHFRRHVREHLCEHSESRKPYIFYNTWNFQERNFNWNKRPYLESMTQERILAEIDVAHRLGIDVYVIDTGWFEKTGDWRVNRKRFPDGLASVKARLDQYGMKLGLWFDNAAALSSEALASHRDCIVRRGAGEPWSQMIWETEESFRLCLVSRYWQAFADELIRLHRDVGVTYFKWDAISQNDCDAAGHEHGDEECLRDARGEAFGFRLPIYLAKIVRRLQAACPEAIVDFDMTEKGRCFGLGFLEVGKFFLINNGPYFWDFDIPKARIADGNANLLFHPGKARAQFMRYPLGFDRWIPANLLLTHYLPDDPAANQANCVASLVLGQNGIWGDLLSIASEGVERIGAALAQYKKVREDVASASPVTQGAVGSTPEWHEKINSENGRGVVCVFGNMAGTFQYITRNNVHPIAWSHEGVEVEMLPWGNAKITAMFGEGESAKVMVFGA